MARKAVLEFSSIFLVALIIFCMFPIDGQAARDKFSVEVKSRMFRGENVPVIVILKSQTFYTNVSDENIAFSLKEHTFENQRSLESMLKEEKSGGNASEVEQFWIVNAISLNASSQLLEKLAENDDIDHIELDSRFHIKEDYSVHVSSVQIANATYEVKRINATEVWVYGIDGSGVNVSIIDTGINSSHPDIAGRVIRWKDYIGGDLSAYDDNGHGTHVAGTVGGNGIGGITTGVAPNVSLFAVKALDGGGSGSASNIIKGIQWSIENNAKIISMSLGTDQTWATNCDNNNQALSTSINNSIRAGIIVVAAAGNDPAGVSAPGCIQNATSVGAVDSNDEIAYFSGRGESMAEHGVVAPGVGITSLNYLTNGYIGYSGTSMATPHTAGTYALLLEAAQKRGIMLSPSEARNILRNASVDLGAIGNDSIYGEGRIDAFETVKRFVLPGRGYINGTVLDNVTRKGIAGAIVTTNMSVSTITNGTGFYSLNLTEGGYALTVAADPEYYSNGQFSITVARDMTTKWDAELIKRPTGSITGSVTNA